MSDVKVANFNIAYCVIVPQVYSAQRDGPNVPVNSSYVFVQTLSDYSRYCAVRQLSQIPRSPSADARWAGPRKPEDADHTRAWLHLVSLC